MAAKGHGGVPIDVGARRRGVLCPRICNDVHGCEGAPTLQWPRGTFEMGRLTKGVDDQGTIVERDRHPG